MDAQNIFLVGLMAVGKSYGVGRQLADALATPFFDADQEVERRAGAEISWIFDVEGEQGFRDREATVIDDLTQRQGRHRIGHGRRCNPARGKSPSFG